MDIFCQSLRRQLFEELNSFLIPLAKEKKDEDPEKKEGDTPLSNMDSQDSDAEICVAFDELYELTPGEQPQEFIIHEKKTDLKLRFWLDITNENEKTLPDVIEHYGWVVHMKRKSKTIQTNLHYFLMMRHWLKKNSMNKLYIEEFVDLIIIYCLKTSTEVEKQEYLLIRSIFERLALKSYGESIKYLIKFQFHKDIFEKI